MTLSFTTTQLESLQIARIVKRAEKLAKKNNLPFDLVTMDMDLSAAHVNGCALDLAKLRAFDDSDFIHDVWGIYRHINRETGELSGHFFPRCAMPTGTTY